jgi:uncharacterized protein YndB with AHSA1/START domain
MTRLHVEAEQIARATPATIWPLISDATQFAQWGPWSVAEYRSPGDTSPHGPGAVYSLRSASRAYGRYVTSVEKTLEVDEGRRLSYTVVGGMPVKNYLGEITLTPVDEATTRIRWTATWDKTLAGQLVQRGLRTFFPPMLADLVAAAEKS